MKKILLILFMTILLVGTISAMDWDNVKSYDEETKTVTVINALNLPLISYDIAKIQLNTPLNYKVPRGYQKVAEFEVRSYKDYSNAFKDLKLFNLKNKGKEFFRDYDYKYKTYVNVSVDDYVQECSLSVNGTNVCKNVISGNHLEQREEWVKLNPADFKKNENLTIGIFTNVEKGDKIEWIPTLFGVKINEWAGWTENLNVGLISYWKLDNNNFTDELGNKTLTNTGTVNSSGIIIDGRDFTSDYFAYDTIFSNEPWTWCGWANIDAYTTGIQPMLFRFGPTTGGNWAGMYLNAGGAGKLNFRNAVAQLTGTADLSAIFGEWHFYCVVVESNDTIGVFYDAVRDITNQMDGVRSYTIFRSGMNYAGGSPNADEYLNGKMDEIAVWGRALNGSEITDLYNNGNGLPYILVFPPVLNSPVDNFNTINQTIVFIGTVINPNGISNVSLIIDGIYNETNSSGINNTEYIFTKILSEGNHNWTYEACGGNGICANATIRNLSIDTTPPEVVLLAPPLIIDLHLINTNLSVNWSANDTNIDTCILQFEGINKTVTCSDNQTEINITNSINRSIIFYVNDTFGHINSTSRSWDYTVFENSQEFNNEILEGVINTFIANVIIIESNSITIANFIYNGTSIIGSFSQSGNDSILTIDFLAPNVDTKTNLTFFWSLILLDGQIINLTSNNQTVISISLDDCSVNTIVLYNYTVVDEGNQSLLSDPANTTTELNINLLDIRRQNYIANFSKKYLKINPFAVCVNENLLFSTYIIDSIVKYEATGYSIEYYNIVNATITNSTIPENITLYDLFSADATEFKITFKAEDFTFVENALIYIDRQYIAENNSFKTVELPKTDSSGQTIGHFVRNDVIYNIRVIKDGIVLGNFRNVIAFCEDYTIGACQMILEATPEDFAIFNYDEQLGIIFQSLPTYNENTSAVSFDFSTDDGTIKTILMEVTRDDIFGNRTICNNTITSSSGTLICSVDPNIDDSVLRVSVSVDGQPIVLSNVKLESSDYGNLGYVFWFFLTFLFLLLFAHSKTEVLIGLAVSFIGAISLGITRGNIIGLGSAGIWVLVIIILGIYKLNKEKPE